jgi:predicted peptidase
MLRLTSAIATILSVSLLHASADADVPVFGPGLHTASLARDPGPGIDFAILVPRTYDGTAPVPLVLGLHFGVQGGSSRYAGRDLLRLLVGPALAELNAIMVAPDALEGRGWNSPRNEEAAMALVDSVMRVYRIDPKRVIVTGFSMGGTGTWHLAGKYPDRFSAALPVAGRPPSARGSWRVPVFAVHSLNDEVVPIEATADRIKELQEQRLRAALVTLEEPTHFQTSDHAEGLIKAVAWLRDLWR